MTKPDMPVTIGLHNFRLKAGESIELDGKGNIFTVGSRGKRTDTGKNIYIKPVTFQGGPLAGDVQGIRYTVTKPYHEQKQSCHHLFGTWKSVLGLTEGLTFHPYTDETNRKLKKTSEIKLFSLILGDARLVASSATPDNLLYIEIAGERFFQVTGGPTKDIPLTVEYIQKCQRSYREYLKAEEVKKLAEMETHGLPERVTKAEREYQDRQTKKQNELELNLCIKEAGEALAKKYDKPIVSKTQALIVAGILQPSQDNLRKAEEEMDAELNKRKPSKKELAELAKKLYNDMKVRTEDKITELELV
jgi:hypothetical protein